jgi:hypothetical protein
MIGIDFGTTNSAVAAVRRGQVQLAQAMFRGKPTTSWRSVLYFSVEERVSVREPAIYAGPTAIEQCLDEGATGRLLLSLKSLLPSRTFETTQILGCVYTLPQLIAELLRRTEANKERNAAAVKRTTEANAFTAYDGTLDKRLVTGLDGSNRYVDGATVRELTRRRRLACAPSVMEPCREVEPVYNDAPPLQLPEIKALRCDADGRNCTFRKSP